jgi:hypothetical protein
MTNKNENINLFMKNEHIMEIYRMQLSPNNNASFMPHLKPSDAVRLPVNDVINFLEKKLGTQFYDAFNPSKTIESPLKSQKNNGSWIKSANMVGINVRTIGSFWNVIKYNLTLPEAQNVIHLLPIWEPGVVASLYGMSSWQINPEFISPELYRAMPHLDTVEKQLKVVINILHGLGKSVGMDVIPHTDRFSEQALANPQCYEWLQRIGYQIVKHDNNLHETVQELIFNFIKNKYPSVLPPTKEQFFSKEFSENDRIRILFGEQFEYARRLERRAELIQMLYVNHFETVPATMGPPYRGLKVDPESEVVYDDEGREWLDFTIKKPQKFSRVFGPLARYKLFENKNNNADWEIDFEKPIVENWNYVAEHYAEIQREYNFDFMRGDMAHVQMRPEGVPSDRLEYYDLMCYIKKYIAKEVPYFASFAETFLAPADEIAYGDEVDHLEMAESEATLGDLQSMVVGSKRFMAEFRRYLDILHTRQVSPCFTMMTGDKDDPRFDEFYVKGNEARFFMGLFMTDMPSYMGLGFEQRDPHLTPAPNEHYTKLYVFRIDEGPKATHGPYVWGSNEILFENLNSIKEYSDKISKNIQNTDCQWIIPPDATGNKKIVAWTQRDKPQYVFVVNLDIDKDVKNIKLPALNHGKEAPQYFEHFGTLKFDFSTEENIETQYNLVVFNGIQYTIEAMKAGEARAYKFEPSVAADSSAE